MKRRFILLVVLSLILCGCGSKEEKARVLFNKGKDLYREGKVEEAKEIFSKITKQYSTTEISIMAQEELDKLKVVETFVGGAESARIATAKIDISSNILVALDLYKLDNWCYPNTEQGIEALVFKTSVKPVPVNWNGPYLKRKPVDPWGNEYKYVCPGTHNNEYDLYSYGPDGEKGGGDDITNWEAE